MRIYDMNNKDIRDNIRDFGRTTYGKIVFILSYMISFITLIASVEVFILTKSVLCDVDWSIPLAIGLLLLSFISFIKGSRYYYKEFRKFVKYINN